MIFSVRIQKKIILRTKQVNKEIREYLLSADKGYKKKRNGTGSNRKTQENKEEEIKTLRQINNKTSHTYTRTYIEKKNAVFCCYIIFSHDSSHCFGCIAGDSFLNGQLAQL